MNCVYILVSYGPNWHPWREPLNKYCFWSGLDPCEESQHRGVINMFALAELKSTGTLSHGNCNSYSCLTMLQCFSFSGGFTSFTKWFFGEGLLLSGEGDFVSGRLTIVMSWILDLFLSFPPISCLMKYFWAWLATWVGVLVVTKLREMFLQSPLPYFFRPIRNCLWWSIKQVSQH